MLAVFPTFTALSLPGCCKHLADKNMIIRLDVLQRLAKFYPHLKKGLDIAHDVPHSSYSQRQRCIDFLLPVTGRYKEDSCTRWWQVMRMLA